MPWKECDQMDERTRFVILALEGVPNFAALCRRFGISRKTGYKWMKRYEETGQLALLRDRSRKPTRSPSKTALEVEGRVVALRQEYGWGARKLQVLLRREGIRLAESTVNRIIKRNGLVRNPGAHRPATKRFEHENPNDLWQVDFKGQFKVQGGYCYPLSILDDHSRYLVGLYGLSSTKAVPVLCCLQNVLEEFGVPKMILTDHGAPFWSTSNPLGMTCVSVFLKGQGIRLTHSGVRHPQTQGKVERMHRSMEESMRHHGKPKTLASAGEWLQTFRYQYNHLRPHEALGMDVPAQHYQPSKRAFQPDPPAWEYPADMQVARLNTQGCLDYGGQRLFVCEALAGHWVGTLQVDGRLVVQFHDQLIREIMLDTRRGMAFAP